MAYGPIGNTNGLTYFSLITQSSGISLTQITNTPTQLCFFSMGNINAAARYLKVIDSPGTVQSSAGFTASMSFIIPGNTAGAGSNGHIAAGPPTLGGLQLNAGLAIAITANAALTDLSGANVGDVNIVLGYR